MLIPFRLTQLAFIPLLAVAGLSACSNATVNLPNPPATSEPTTQETAKPSEPIAQAPQNTSSAQNRVKVFFPKPAANNTDLAYVEPVWRSTNSSGVAKFAIEQLIAGPTESEQQLGLKSAIALKDSSNCGGDFTISIKNKVARLQFCRSVVSAGVGDDARAKSAITTTLTQFPTINTAVILDKSGNCFGDLSGENICLEQTQSAEKLTANSKLTTSSLGPVEVGMTVAEAAKAARIEFGPEPSGGEEWGCSYVQPKGQPADVAFMVTDGQIARIDIDSKKVKTLSGAGIGDTEAQIRKLYPGQIETEPHKYVPGGKYLIFVPRTPSERNYRVIFETDENGVVKRFRSGKLPEVAYVEGCA